MDDDISYPSFCEHMRTTFGPKWVVARTLTDGLRRKGHEKVSKTLLKTADRYLARMRRGEKIMRDSKGSMQWASGKPVGRKTVQYMLGEHMVAELDTDLFGSRPHGQTIGLAQ